ncbi:MAG: hypothetical protein RL030_2750 [Pseudomonadota bacterium]|jgi:hypothetical protein
MSSPSVSQAIQRPDIRNAVVEEWSATGELAEFTANLIAGRIDVPNAAGTLKRIPREAMTKDPNTVGRGGDGNYQEVTWGDETFTYLTKEQGLQAPIDENAKAQTSLYYDAQKAATRIVLSKLLRMHEKDVASKVFNTTTFTGASLTTAVGVPWSTPATATPIADVNAAKVKVRQNCGRKANALILSWTAWQNLKETTQILNRINGGATSDKPAFAQMAMVAGLMELDRIIIAGGIKDTAKQGQNFTAADIWDATKAMVGYVNPSPSLYDINLCNAYNWEGDGGSFDFTVEEYWDEPTRRTVVRARRQIGVKVEYSECGHLLTAV